jgi:hypothetical protein
LISSRRALVVGCAAIMLAIIGSSGASAASWFEKNFGLIGPRFDAILPPCQSLDALGSIQYKFAQKEGRFWVSNLTIERFDRIHETAFRPWVEGAIPRRYCSGVALISDGVWRPVHFSIIEDGGMIGHSWGVEFCIAGIDRNWAYNPSCKLARP